MFLFFANFFSNGVYRGCRCIRNYWCTYVPIENFAYATPQLSNVILPNAHVWCELYDITYCCAKISDILGISTISILYFIISCMVSGGGLHKSAATKLLRALWTSILLNVARARLRAPLRDGTLPVRDSTTLVHSRATLSLQGTPHTHCIKIELKRKCWSS